MNDISRREALQTLGVLCCGALMPPALMSCASSKQVTQKEEANVLTLLLDEYEGDTLIVKSKKYMYPISVSRSEDGKFIALLMQCTHKGCELRSEGTYLVCPCHGSEFDSQGKVLNPPADKPLRAFPVRTDEQYIYIDIS
ncbi:MAG TPA: Rieske (2Fe-2S) protein [Candidatus Kapabacteria bacterium]